jgi:hypothetical protein
MLVIGQIPADYVPLHPADELARCQRYYQRINAGQYGMGFVNSGNSAYIQVPLKATFAVSPSLTTSSPISNITIMAGAAPAGACASISLYQNLPEAVSLGCTITTSTLTTGQGVLLRASAAGDYLAFEGNP